MGSENLRNLKFAFFWMGCGVGHLYIVFGNSNPTVMSGHNIPPSAIKCRIAEIVQYSCDLEKLGNGRPQFRCFPIPRIFRM
jgi:hypothetical protein